MDNHTVEQRSYNMSRIRSRFTRQEIFIDMKLSELKIEHIMYPNIQGNPDLILGHTAVFINGCFWHKCPKCFHMPKTNVKYWSEKINKNTKRDRKNINILKSQKFRVITVWEHEIMEDPYGTVEKLIMKSEGL